MNFLDMLVVTIDETHDLAGFLVVVCLYIAVVVTYMALKK